MVTSSAMLSLMVTSSAMLSLMVPSSAILSLMVTSSAMLLELASSAILKATLLELASSAILKATLLELASANRSESQKATMSVLELANQWVYLMVPLMEEESAMTFPMGLGSATIFPKE